MTSNPSDDALMAEVAQGKETAFRLLVQRWEHQVKAFLTQMLGTVEEAEDLTQDTFVQVFHKASSYQGQGQFRSWLFRIAGNYARSRLRRRKIVGWVRFQPGAHDLAAKTADPSEELSASENKALLDAALSRLPDRQRQAISLHRFQGLKYKEIAQAMDTTVPGVESLIQRAMVGLKAELTGKG